MPRAAKLGKHKGQWCTKAGNPNGVYFGRVDEVSYRDAQKLFRSHLSSLTTKTLVKPVGITVAELMDKFLAWAETSRGERTFGERRQHLGRFVHFRKGSDLIADVPATSVDADDLKDFLAYLKEHDRQNEKWVKRKAALDPFTVGKYQTSIMACFAWGAGKRNPKPCLPRDFHPFLGMERHKRPPEPLLETELPTKEEIGKLLHHADDDLAIVVERNRYRSRRPEEAREDHPYKGFKDLLTVYHQTGARTSELAVARVGEFVRGAGQIVLGKHKRSKTLKETATRRITLSGEALAIVQKLCEGKTSNDPIFTDQKGRAWDRYTLDMRFKHVRTRAKVRDDITIYSFRHLWISEALMAGIDVSTVSKMAGTSIAMIEKVYGHYRNDHFADAQKKLMAARSARNETGTAA
jgi:integrase